MPNNSTRKKTKVMTIPQLRKAFERLDGETKKILSSHPVNDQSIVDFQKVWKSIFHKSIDKSTAESYLQIQKQGGKKTRKNKKMKGGSAPIDYTLRPGLDGTHGTFQPYISSGLSFYNSINNIAMDSDCGKVDITPTVSAGMGNNLFSGGDLSQMLGSRYVTSTVPPSITQDLQDMSLGRRLGDSPSVLDTVYRGSNQ